MLFGIAMSEFSELIVDLEAALGRDVPLLIERLFLAPGWSARFDLLDDIILARVEAARRPSPDVAWAWSRLSQAQGRVRIGSLATELGCSRRHLNARFRERRTLVPPTSPTGGET